MSNQNPASGKLTNSFTLARSANHCRNEVPEEHRSTWLINRWKPHKGNSHPLA